MKNSIKKSFLKTITWRICSSFTTFTIVFMFTKQFAMSFGIIALEIIIKLFLYFMHERAWENDMTNE